MTEPSIFTRILNGEIPAEIIGETDRLFALRDIAPQAPVHLLVVPKTAEYRDVTELAAGDATLLADMIAFAGSSPRSTPKTATSASSSTPARTPGRPCSTSTRMCWAAD